MSVPFALIIVFLIFLLLNMPVAIALGCSSLISIVFLSQNLPLEIIVQRIFTSLDSFTMMAIPLFMLAGSLMNSSGITERIIKLSDLIVGHIRGGLAQTNILASIFFSGISGSAAADTAVLGSMLIPSMKKKGYDTDFAVVVTCTSSCIGPIIPPSIMFIIYASITGISISKLFLAGIMPGLLVGISLMIITYFIAKKRNYPRNQKAKFSEVLKAFTQTIDALVMPLIIIGGVSSGVFTATESGAVAVFYAIIIGVYKKKLNFKKFYNSIYEAAIMTGATMLIIATASLFSWLLTINQFPLLVTQLLVGISSSKTIITLLLILLFLIVGLFIDGTSAIMILVPVLYPIAMQFGFDQTHFALFMVVTILIGGITPPVGILLYIACSIGEIEIKDTIRMLIPYITTMIIVAIILAFFPSITLFIPNLFF